MNVTIRSVCLMASLIITIFIAKAQSLSPNAAAAANSGAAITGPYTGKPAISVPVTSLHGRNIRIPVSLDYNASGVRVEDVGSWVGLGWNLSAGGVITREIRGANDFAAKGYFAQDIALPPNEIIDDCQSGGVQYEDYIKDVISGSRDAEPDLYNLSFPGFSAQFFFDQAGEPYTIPRQKLKIERPSTQDGEWIITTLDGYQYKFGGSGFNEGSTVTAWYLKEIVSPTGELASFHYTREDIEYELLASEFRLFAVDGTCDAEDEIIKYSRDVDLQSLFLERIEIGNSTLEFVLADRCDIIGKRLDKILLKEAGSVISSFHFNFSCDEAKQRLWLTAFRQAGNNGNTLPPYRFEYDDKDALPGIRSYAQDHWGFYNGKTGNTLLTPSYLLPDFSFSGANRDANPNYLTKGTLKRVTYPMGGYTDYTFEENDYNNYTDDYPELTESSASVRAAEGFRAGSTSSSRSFTLNTATTVNFEFVLDQIPVIEEGFDEEPTTGEEESNEGFYVRLTGESGTTTWSSSGTSTKYLQAGTYTLQASIDDRDPEVYSAEITASFKYLSTVSSSPSSRYGGGIRVSQIVTNDDLNQSEDVVQTFEYQDFSTGETSGKLMSGPVYHYKIRSYCDETNYTDYLVFFSSSTIPLSSAAAGSYVGYSNITVYNKDGEEEGRTRFSYFNEAEAFTFSESRLNLGDKVPFAPTTGDWYKNGLLDYREDYRYYEGQFFLQSRQESMYDFVDNVSGKGLVVVDGGIYENKCLDLFYGFYTLNTAWIQQKEVLSTVYDGDASATGNAITSTMHNTYDSNDPWMLLSQFAAGSESEEYVTEYKYPKHFGTGVFNGAIDGMMEDYLLSVPIQTIAKRQPSGSNTYYVTGSSVTSFQEVAGTYLPDQVYSLEIADPVTDYAFNSTDPTSDGRMKLQATYTYDAFGNVIQTQREELVSSSMYGYEDDLVIASVRNAEAGEIAYAGFETEVQGGWSYDAGSVQAEDTYAGRGAFSNGSIVSGTLPDQVYMIELWAKGSGSVTVGGETKNTSANWQYFSWQITATSVTVQVPSGVVIDELRLYPIDAMMTSYTYEPAVGMTSAMGNNGKAVFTEYDHFNRTVSQRDFKKQLLSTKDYSLRANLYGMIEVPDQIDIYSEATFSVNLGEDLPRGVTCAWDFGDGSSSQTGESVTHTYTKIGYKEVLLTLSKEGYSPVVERKRIFVGGELEGEIAHDAAHFNEVIDFWLEGIEENPEGTTYTWSYLSQEAEGATTSYVFNVLGTHLFQVTMEHPDFPIRTIYIFVEVIPLGTLEGSITNTTSVLDESFDLSVIGIEDNPSGTTYSWSFDDKTGTAVSHTYNRLGVYSATVTMSAWGYPTRSVSKSIKVEGDMSADWSGPSTLVEDVAGSFGATSAAKNRNPADATYEWTLMDGSSEVQLYGSGINKAFTTPTGDGTTTVSLTVSHPEYASKTSTKSLTVEYGPPIFTAATPPEVNPIITLKVDNAKPPFDFYIKQDGVIQYSRENTTSRSVDFNTTYVGSFTITMEVVDDNGQKAQIERTIFGGPVED